MNFTFEIQKLTGINGDNIILISQIEVGQLVLLTVKASGLLTSR
jgi:hypothetical protein